MLPNYDECIVNIACSISKYFNIDYKHQTIKELDEILENKNPKNVVVILYDGMGYNLINKLLTENSFFRKNMIRSIDSVVPPTTTASTRSMLTGLYPKEHGWLGWDLYIKGEDKIVTLFTNKIKDTEIEAAPYNVAMHYYPYTSIIEKINNNTEYKAYDISPYSKISYTNIDEMLDIINTKCLEEGKKYIYAYYEEPDHSMHRKGIEECKSIFEELNDKTEELCNKLEDTVLIIIADHGHKECETITLSDYPDFLATLDNNVWIEGRTCSFKVKNKENFLKLFNKYFSNDFILKTKDEVIEENIFGKGKEHELFRDSLGDFIALTNSNKVFRYDNNSKIFKSVHAGLSDDEKKIPLIIITK